MPQERNKAHLVYMTGLSTDKKKLNYITENIHFDKDFKYWYSYIDALTSAALSSFQRYITMNKKDIQETGIEIVSKFLEYTHLDRATILVEPVIKKMLKTIAKETDVLQRNNELLLKFIASSEKKQSEYNIADFFSFYISHQSDSLGVMPLSVLSKEKKFTFINSYCDMDYFINKFIDSIIIKVDSRILRYNEDGNDFNFQQFAKDIFTTHLFDIYSSKLFTDFEYKNKEDTISVFGFNETQQQYWKDMKQAFEERNFFGVSLLSYFFAGLLSELDTDKITIHLACDDKINDGYNVFLKELIEYATDPEKVEFVDESDEPMISIKLYVSNGRELENKDLHKDDYFKSVYNLMEQEINEDFIYSTVEYNTVDIPDTYTKCESDSYRYIKLPVKMMLSLPRDKEGKVKQSLYLPYMIDNEAKDNIDILTIGGAEHNRALAHLINKHRQQYKSKRIFGFLDNYFDLESKLNHLDDLEYEQGFLMALNQPVAGYNAIFAARRDDKDGRSDAWEAKVIAFSLKDGHRKFNIVAVYGFSALASVYATHNIVASIDKMENVNGILFDPNEQYYISMKRRLRDEIKNTEEYTNKGLAILYRYKKGVSVELLNQYFDNKHASFIFINDREKYHKAFSDLDRDAIDIFSGELNKGLRHRI